MAAEKLAQNLLTHSPEEAWKLVIRNFLENNQWNFKTQVKKPKVKQTEEQKIFWQLFKYVWAFFQTMVILKIGLLYFGLNTAENSDQTNVVWVWLCFAVSAGSLFSFAYRNRKDGT